MQESSHTGGALDKRRAARQARLFATFKLATPYIEVIHKSTGAGEAKIAANVNRVGLVPSAAAPVRHDP